MLAYFPLINTCISLGLAFCVASASLKELSKLRIGSIIVMAAVLPLSVIFVTNNLDSVCLCIAALAVFYTLTILVFSPMELGRFLLASTAGGNIGSSTGAGIGSSTGAGIDSSSGSTSREETVNWPINRDNDVD